MKKRVIFKLDYKQDAENYWATAHSKGSYGYKWEINPDIKRKIGNKSWPKSRNFLYGYLKKYYKGNNRLLVLVLKQFEEAWRLIEEEYFRRLEKITKKPIYTKKFIAYLTTTGRCPYDLKKNSFMINFFGSATSALRVCCHEIMHLQFHHYFWSRCRKELTEAQTHDLKEAFTVLLNEEFNNLIIVKDMGYPKHEKLRKYLASVWKKTNNFDRTLERGIKYLKK